MEFSRIAPCDDPSFAPIQARYMSAMDALPPGQGVTGQRLLKRISSMNWLLEWNLPRWLGEAFDLPTATTRELILANVYGLAYVRLQDDLFDDETEGEWQETTLLAKALHDRWIEQYRPLFNRTSSFWQHLDNYTGQWLRATLDTDGPGGADLRLGRAESMHWLAERGAPLKVCCVAVSLLAGIEAVMPRLLAGVDHLLAGAVLVDHAGDWQADWMAGRYNALVAFVSPQSCVEPGQQTSCSAILQALYLESAARPYFELAQQQFRRGRECVQGLGIPEMEAYLAWAEAETGTYYTRLAQGNARRLRMATADLLRFTENVDVSQT